MERESDCVNAAECLRETSYNNILFPLVLALAEHLEEHPEFAGALTSHCNCAVPRKSHVQIKRLIGVNRKDFFHLVLNLVQRREGELVFLVLWQQFFASIVQNNSVFITCVEELVIRTELQTCDPSVVVMDDFGWTCLVVQVEYPK